MLTAFRRELGGERIVRQRVAAFLQASRRARTLRPLGSRWRCMITPFATLVLEILQS